MSKQAARFQYESLESRQMMAGDIAAYVQNGNLYLNEATGQAGRDNAAFVSHLSNGLVRVRGGATADGTKSLINGREYQDFSVASSLNVKFGAGNDSIVLTEPDGRSFFDINIDMAAPPLTNAPAAKTSKAGAVPTAYNPPDNDYVTLWGAGTRGTLNVTTGAGADYVQVLGGTFGDGYGPEEKFLVNTGAGADQVEVSDINGFWLSGFDIQTYSSLNETDADSVALSSLNFYRSIGVRLGGGGDGFSLTDIEIYGRLDVDAGAGNDNGVLERVYAGDQVMARLGEGDDNLRLDGVTATKLSFLGEGGVDRLTKAANLSYSTLELTGWEYINGVSQTSNSLPAAKAAGAKKAK